jgi:hypothetical protein
MLEELVELRAAMWRDDVLALTEQGMEWSDVIGPWLFSNSMNARMESYALA